MIAAITLAIIQGIAVTDAARLPEQLANLIVDTRTTPPDAALLLDTSSGATSVFAYFVGATLPEPGHRNCDNSDLKARLGIISSSSNVPTIDLGRSLCLNATPIPRAAPTDPHFVVQQEGATAVTPSPTLTWRDPGTGATVTARLSRTWFVTRVDGTTAQTLRIAYTDWAGQRQNAWLVGNPADGYTFIRYALPGDAGAPAAPADQSTCLTSGDCSYSAAIEYVGGDGLKYTASVRAPARPAGAPAYSAPEEGSPATFEANGFGPAGAVAPVAYRWRFQKTGCITPGGLTGCQVALNDGTVTGNYGPDYSAPVAGETVAFTWDASGPAQVELTATDAAGATVTTAFPVAVANAPPTVGLTPDCPGGSCVPRTVEMGIPVRLQGWARDPAARDALRVTIDWGDGSEHQHGCTSGGCFGLLGGVDLGSDGFRAGLDITLESTHTYATVGIYHGTVWVTDDGGADSEPFTITIADPPPLAIPAVPAQTIGGFALVVPAMGGHSRLPVSLAVTGDPGVCAVTTNPVPSPSPAPSPAPPAPAGRPGCAPTSSWSCSGRAPARSPPARSATGCTRRRRPPRGASPSSCPS